MPRLSHGTREGVQRRRQLLKHNAGDGGEGRAARPSHDTPPLSDYAVSREGIYEGRP